jgi:hypothetical protein
MDLFTELPALEIYGAKAAGKTSTAARFCIHNFKLDIQEAYDVVQGGLQTIEVLR